MNAKIITIFNSKGGCGKSLASQALASSFVKRNIRTLLVDADAQGTSTTWSKAAPENASISVPVMNFSVYGEKIHREIQKQLENYEIIIVDCGPSIDALQPLSALLVSDLAILPVSLSPPDIWASCQARTLIERAQTLNPNLRSVILPSRVSRTTLSKAIMSELDSFGIPILEAQLSNRIAFQEAMLGGVSVSDLGRGGRQAAAEVNVLTNAILELLGENDE